MSTQLDLLQGKQQKPVIPEKWDYELSVINTKAQLLKWKTLTYDMAVELYVAREKLRAQGRRTDLDANQSKSPTWGQYCEDIGIDKSTVNRWLEAIFGEPKELPNAGEITDIKDINTGVVFECKICDKKFVMFHRERSNKDEADHRLEELGA